MNAFLTQHKIFAILITATGHNINHDSFNNVYNVKAETPLGILFKDQSVMETSSEEPPDFIISLKHSCKMPKNRGEGCTWPGIMKSKLTRCDFFTFDN
jgi:hypothetical protein